MESELLNTIHVAILDDHFAVRLGYKYLLDSFSFTSQVSAFSEGNELMHYLGQPGNVVHVVLVDVRLHEESGFDICRNIKLAFNDTRVLMMSAGYDKDYVLQAIQCGSDGFLCKDAGSEEMEKAFRWVAFEHRKYYSMRAKEAIISMDAHLLQGND